MADLAAARRAGVAQRLKPAIRFVEKNRWEEGFSVIFDEKILPHLEGLEAERVAKKASVIRRGLIGAGAVIALAVLLFGVIGLSGDAAEFGLFAVFASALGAGWYAWQPAMAYRAEYKRKIMPALAGFLGDFAYDDDGSIEMARLQPSGIIPSHDSYHSEDRFTGQYEEVGLDIAEAKLTETRGSGKNRRTVTTFRGLFVLIEMNKPFRGKTQVKGDAGIFNALGGAFSKLERVKLEDPEFEKRYEVYSSDQVEARYLLTTAFMQRMLNLSKLYGNAKLRFAFYDNRLLILIGVGRNQFEPASLFEPVINISALRQTLQEFHTVCSIIDELKMNQRIGL